mmetsp:Transcript_4787/g.8886  ORF Transcript_4787/g.8886 Transcript_4787/m.8886 type:complete len:85 (+) Transcript_4787:97-351(+)
MSLHKGESSISTFNDSPSATAKQRAADSLDICVALHFLVRFRFSTLHSVVFRGVLVICCKFDAQQLEDDQCPASIRAVSRIASL